MTFCRFAPVRDYPEKPLYLRPLLVRSNGAFWDISGFFISVLKIFKSYETLKISTTEIKNSVIKYDKDN